ncbi:unnamed protein product [Mesocestoides corti]|uniref:1-phosphatidylinositol 4-kinase n=1 Tax=Mesocestoides corti TaxID=53468 RepID=A0A0R3UFT1_MESCO|nr:unnamed protein product [Mesocestoides corti]
MSLSPSFISNYAPLQSPCLKIVTNAFPVVPVDTATQNNGLSAQRKKGIVQTQKVGEMCGRGFDGRSTDAVRAGDEAAADYVGRHWVCVCAVRPHISPRTL